MYFLPFSFFSIQCSSTSEKCQPETLKPESLYIFLNITNLCFTSLSNIKIWTPVFLLPSWLDGVTSKDHRAISCSPFHTTGSVCTAQHRAQPARAPQTSPGPLGSDFPRGRARLRQRPAGRFSTTDRARSGPELFTRAVRALYTGFTRGLHRVYTGFTRGLHVIYAGCTSGLHGLYTGLTQGVHGVYTGCTCSMQFTQDLHGVYTRSLWDLHGVYEWFT